MTNYTVMKITDPDDARLNQPGDGEMEGYLRGEVRRGRPMYSTWVRGAGSTLHRPNGTIEREDNPIWGEEVFVCPDCAHATLLEDDDGAVETGPYWCKYCHSTWDPNIPKKIEDE